MRRMFMLLSMLLAMALVTAACGETQDTGFPPAPETSEADHGEGENGGEGPEFEASPEPQDGPATELTIQAKGIKFNRTEMLFAADEEITLTFDNLDPSIPHNVAIYEDDSAETVLFDGEEFPGVASQDYEIPATGAGEYYFQCDVHPDMNGTATFS